MLRVLCAAGLALSLATGSAGADDRPVRVAIDPAKAGPDFLVQGEYAGALASGQQLGVQVVALGSAEFDAAIFAGGLPGAGAESAAAAGAHGATADGLTSLKGEKYQLEIRDGAMRVLTADGAELGKLSKVERTSPTLEAKPPEGAIVLFDGATADNFERARLLPEKSLPAGATSKQPFGSGRWHVEFRTPFMPTHRGQNRGNSGVYLQGRYEVQVLDSFGLPPADNECGGLYGFRAPTANVCFPPLSWQTYDIEFREPTFDAEGKKTSNARLSVALNGVPVQEDVELPHESGLGAAESPEPGPLHLQFHLCPVQFRNIWFVPAGE